MRQAATASDDGFLCVSQGDNACPLLTDLASRSDPQIASCDHARLLARLRMRPVTTASCTLLPHAERGDQAIFDCVACGIKPGLGQYQAISSGASAAPPVSP